jgi:hypothetical protein
METSELRKRVIAAIDRARRSAAARRVLADNASREYTAFLERIAVPLFRQVAATLKAENHAFQVFTPSGSVRLMSDRNAQDYIEITLDTTGPSPIVLGRSSRNRGGRVLEVERPVGEGAVSEIDEEQLLSYLLTELEPFVER